MATATDLKNLCKAISKTTGTIVSTVKDVPTVNVETFSSGSPSLDYAIGVGGYPKGKIIELYGNQGSGKTLLALLAIAEVQRTGGSAVFVDMEHTFNTTWAKKLGVDTDKLMISQPDYGEQALDVVEQVADSGIVNLVVLDSVASLCPLAELEGKIEENNAMGLQARMIGKALRRLTARANRTKTTIIFINQIRSKIGFVLGSPDIRPGGKALDFLATLIIKTVKLNKTVIKDADGRPCAHTMVTRIEKNKIAPFGGEAEIPIIYTEGIDKAGELVNMATKLGVISQSASSYTFGTQKWKGRQSVTSAIKADQKLQDKLRKEVTDAIAADAKKKDGTSEDSK